MSAFDPLAIGANKPNQSSSYSTVPTSHCLPALGLDENQVQFLEQQGFSSGERTTIIIKEKVPHLIVDLLKNVNRLIFNEYIMLPAQNFF